MGGSIYKSGAGAILQQMRLDVYSNNLANMNTVGYKADQPVFRPEDINAPADTPVNAPKLSPFAMPLKSVTNFDSGAMQRTGGQLDVAISGKGFFEIQTPDGPQYTRSGRFGINDNGELSTSAGHPVMGQGGAIVIEGGPVVFGQDGQVTVNGEVVGVLRVVDFKDPQQLQKSGSTMFQTINPAAGKANATDYSISQGVLEDSNVDPIRTMTDLIETMRVFETYQKVIKAADDATAKTVNEVGRSV